MELVIRGRTDRDFLRFLLDEAQKEGFGIQSVRQLPDGLYIPLELADHVGLLDHLKTVPEAISGAEPESEPVKPKRASSRGRKPKPVAAETPAEPEVPAEEDPWS